MSPAMYVRAMSWYCCTRCTYETDEKGGDKLCSEREVVFDPVQVEGQKQFIRQLQVMFVRHDESLCAQNQLGVNRFLSFECGS